MQRIIANMMQWLGISEARLREEGEIATPIGQTLYWDYYCYVKDNPVLQWPTPTALLYGGKDELCEKAAVQAFAEKFACGFDIFEQAEHYFHTAEELAFFRQWLQKRL